MAALLVVALMASGCGDGGTSEGKEGTLDVVAAFYPAFEAAREVGGDRVDVLNLTPAGVEPHDLELNPDQVDAVLDADVALYFGGGVQPALEDAASQADGVKVDLLEGLPLREGPEGTDPHVWLDPVLMARIVERIARVFSREDPQGADAYARNADVYESRLEELDRSFEEGLATCARRVIVTSHAAFGYLADRYGLEQEAISGLSPEAEPDPKRLQELVDLVKERGVTTVFSEELLSPAVAETLAREAGVRTAVLDPLEGLTSKEQEAGEDYVSIMRKNLAVLRSALECT